MAATILVMPGSARLDLRALRAVAREFGWAVQVAGDLRTAAETQADEKSDAVLFHRDAPGAGCSWLDAVRLLRLTLPEARLIACHGFAESINWPELCDAGAFHALGLPLNENEVRKSLGFLAQAVKRLEPETQNARS
jgi:hypothetical protein